MTRGYYVSLMKCIVSKDGAQGFRTCKNGHVSIMCDECSAVYIHPNDIELGDPPARFGQSIVECPHCDALLRGDGSYWSTLDEIIEIGWDEYIQGESGLL